MNSLTETKRRPTDWQGAEMQQRIARRYASERRFKALGMAAVMLSAGFLAFLLVVMVGNGFRGFTQTELPVEIDFPAVTGGASPSQFQGPNANANLQSMGLREIVDSSIEIQYGQDGTSLFSSGGWTAVNAMILSNPDIVEQKATVYLPVISDIDVAYKDAGNLESEQKVRELGDKFSTGFNWNFLSNSDATDPMQVGIWGAFKGSLITMIVTLLLAFPVGVLAALYLEEYAPKKPVDRPDRGFDRQSGCGAVDHLRSAWSGGLSELFWHAAIRCAGWRPDAGPDDHAGDCHYWSQRCEIGATFYP